MAVLLAHGFVPIRQDGGSHKVYRGLVNGEVRNVTVAAHRLKDEIKPGTLDAMMKQSGLPKSLFRR